MSKADKILALAYVIRRQTYVLGNEPWYDIAGEPSSDPLAGDCSGLMIGLWRRAGVLFTKAGSQVTYDKLFGTARPTANVMYKWCKTNQRLVGSRPVRFGQLGFRVDGSDVAHHVWMYIPHPSRPEATIEFGDGTGRADMHDVAWQEAKLANYRGYKIVYGDLPDDIGQLSLPQPANPDLIDWPLPMRKGLSSPYVRELKSLLIQVLGLSWVGVLTITHTSAGNTFGATTEYYVKQAQKKLGLPETGVVDAALLREMQRALL